MKKSKKLKKDLSRLASYLKKETARLEKLMAHAIDSDISTADVWRRLQDRQRAALADLDAIRASEATAKAQEKTAAKKSASEARKKPAAPVAKKAATKKPAPRRTAKTS